MALLAPLALIIALIAPSMASATATSVLPSNKLSDYTGVDCTVVSSGSACKNTAFTARSTASILKVGGALIANCEVTLNGVVQSNGATSITSGSVAGPGECENITLDFTKAWTDQICEYAGASPHQMWDRLIVHFQLGASVIEGPIFLRLQTAAGADGDPLTVGRALVPGSEIDSTGVTITATPTEGAPYLFSGTQFRVASNTAACSWPTGEGLE
jgi:hypothetical protein